MADLALQLEILREVLLALLLGGVIGYERETADKPAGFRTQMMVAGAAALLVGLGAILVDGFEPGDPAGLVRTDPLRVMEAIITAVGFIGAGTIFRRGAGDHIEGLTTAATLLMSAAIGIAVALDRVPLAVGVTLLTLGVLRGLRSVEEALERRRRP